MNIAPCFCYLGLRCLCHARGRCVLESPHRNLQRLSRSTVIAFDLSLCLCLAYRSVQGQISFCLPLSIHSDLLYYISRRIEIIVITHRIDNCKLNV